MRPPRASARWCCWPATRGSARRGCAAELAARAHEDGAAVLYGRFDEETLTPYQPVVEMLRGWSAGAPLDSLRDRLGPRAAELGDPAAGVRRRRPPTTSRGGRDRAGPEADAQRFRFFDAVAALLGEIGAEAPVVLVFDDLQWADRPTLQLLRHLVRAPAPRRVLFLGTYRESEISDRHPLHELIGDLRREGTLRRLELGGLDGARGRRAGRRAGLRAGLGRPSCARWRARPRATRSSSRRSCATSATRPARCRRR